MTSEKCSTCESYKRAKLTKQKAIAAVARRPTSSQLCVRGLSCDSDAYGCVGIVAVGVLAALAGAVEAEAPTSLVAILALDVEARPGPKMENHPLLMAALCLLARGACLSLAWSGYDYESDSGHS